MDHLGHQETIHSHGDTGVAVTLLDGFELITSTSNTTDQDENHAEGPSITWLVFVPLIVGTIIIITVVGNALVILAYWVDPRIHNRPANLFILNLAVSDFIVGLVVMSINLSWITWNEWLGGDYWLLGETFCKVWLVVDNTACMLSVLMIILISLDRYWLLTKKLRYHQFQTRKRVSVTIVVLWFVVTSAYSILAFGWAALSDQSEVDFTKECELDMTYNVYATIVQLTLEFTVPLFIIIVLNIIVYHKIRIRARGLKRLSLDKKSSKTNTHSHHPNKTSSAENVPPEPKLTASQASVHSASNTTLNFSSKSRLNESPRTVEFDESAFSNIALDQQTPVERSESDAGRGPAANAQTQRRLREYVRHRRAAVVLAVLVGVFITCWMPYHTVNVINAICGESCISYLTWEIVNNILWCNSLINPFLYAATNVHFRRNFIIFLRLNHFRCFQKTMRSAARPSSTIDHQTRRHKTKNGLRT